MSVQERRIVIIGGGIIGCTTAYYLTRHPAFVTSHAHITLLEASAVAAGASGKAGGLVAAWAYPHELASVSFDEHRRLAEEHGGAERWGWRELTCGQWDGRMSGTATRRATKLPPELDWVDAALTDGYTRIGSPGETAQVHPFQFTTSMLELAKERVGERLELITQARVTAVERANAEDGEDERVVGVTYMLAGKDTAMYVPADKVLLAAGPWSPTLLPSLPITTTRAHSIVMEPATALAPYALFTSIRDPTSDNTATPEIYARPGNRVYACGSGDDMPLPELASLVQTSPAAIAELRAQVAAISPPLRDGTVETEQACYLPLGGPIVGPVDNVQGLVVATGHTCWGICNAPGTGQAVAELIMDGAVSHRWKLGKLLPRVFLKN